MLTLLIDNHDSYTFNLFHGLAEVNGVEPIVVRNDARAWEEVERWAFDNIVLSPGPGHPGQRRDFGICRAALEHADVPVLGVCLGHQGLAEVAGGLVAEADEPVHGRVSRVFHDGTGVFAGLPQGFGAVRYHSLAVRRVPPSLRRTAWTEDGVVMGLADPARPRHGVQFHPESVASEHGLRLLENFRDLTRAHASARPVDGRRARGARLPPQQGRPAPPHREPAGPPALEVHLRRLPHPPEPETAFLALYADAPDCFWLDSSLAGATVARFSFMGDARGPLARVLTHDAAAGVTREREHPSPAETRFPSPSRAENGSRLEEGVIEYHGDLLLHLSERLRALRCDAPAAPFGLTGGYVGWLGYELTGGGGGAGGPDRPAVHRSDLPDAALILADRLLAFDHESGELHLVCLTAAGDGAAASAWFDATAAVLAKLPRGAAPDPVLPAPDPLAPPLHVRATRSRAEYAARIADCQAAIRRGESYELCLTDELRITTGLDPLTLHRVLRRRSPAPHASFVRIGGVTLVSSSPERFLSVDRAGAVESRPIKGTAPRGADPAEDARARAALAASAKDRAEHLMIVDLARHDLGAVCAVGSVHVPELMVVEPYATVHQLVSSVRGTLAPGLDATDAVRAAFPPGSMTGAPKERTMELLDALEDRPRGPYAGAVGYLALNGAADLAVTIRTAVCTAGEVRIGAGGAIVLQSDPAGEVEELLLKARAVVEAVALCARGDAGAHDLGAPAPAAAPASGPAQPRRA
ncbi:aminodeoxychorismate synthase component I [Paraconexibacter antarcticus]|uniref:aminodeoxychorismate synthase n=1 Tax=Paraconexibacter antarcticus TaxID=2949664 RepID=A0ABY5DUH7_9ACTN|nr:aminodeoxychorismate synthase component I [Paraconexibacter antarcticus]UTI65239.1 aminodeoxychorismate synthase component I [Paraconexibacter antarcticus]